MGANKTEISFGVDALALPRERGFRECAASEDDRPCWPTIRSKAERGE